MSIGGPHEILPPHETKPTATTMPAITSTIRSLLVGPEPQQSRDHEHYRRIPLGGLLGQPVDMPVAEV